MDENEILDSGTDEEITEAEDIETEVEANEDDDGGFEYDEDGNIIVDGEDEDEEKNEAAEDTDTDDNDDGTNNAEEPEQEPAEEPKAEPLAKSADKSSNDEFANFKRLAKDMLEKLGVQNVTEDGLIEAMIKTAADASDKTVDEYKAELKKRDDEESARIAQISAEFEKVSQADLAELKKHFPELKDIKRLDELPNWQDFGRLRGVGVSAVTAYKNACADDMAKRKPTNTKTADGTKGHLRSNMGKSAKAGSSGPSMSELRVLRDSFPDLSDKEIIKLYNKTKTN